MMKLFSDSVSDQATVASIAKTQLRTRGPVEGDPEVRRSAMTRLAGLTAGLGVQAGFVVTVVSLFEFLRFGSGNIQSDWFLIDLMLALQFAVPHSLLLHPAARRFLRPWVSPEFYGLFYCLCTCLSLQVIFRCWRSSNSMLWDFGPVGTSLMLTGFYVSWCMLFYSLYLSGLGYQTGLTQWLFWWKGETLPRREFTPRSLYRWFRHPVYLSFLGLIWFSPGMSLDHALLTGVWTVYIFAGSWLKDERLQYYMGDLYRSYRQRVPAYPLLKIAGPFTKSESEEPVRSAA